MGGSDFVATLLRTIAGSSNNVEYTYVFNVVLRRQISLAQGQRSFLLGLKVNQNERNATRHPP